MLAAIPFKLEVLAGKTLKGRLRGSPSELIENADDAITDSCPSLYSILIVRDLLIKRIS